MWFYILLLQRQKSCFTAGTELVFITSGEILNCIYIEEKDKAQVNLNVSNNLLFLACFFALFL